PVHRLLTVCVSAGPELHLVDQVYVLNVTTAGFQERTSQYVNATRLGAQASAMLELHLNDRVALFAEVLGRYAKISGLKGTGTYYRLENNISSTIETDGYLYYLSGEKHPRLAILAAEPGAGQDARKALLDFTGVGLGGGLRFRF
ncbi:MAG: hypothetical protein AB1715_05145, partial [Acidobacteriota bacterium]